jgi:regulator of replication initiation timing
MEATVTLSLKEIEKLKSTLKRLEDENVELKLRMEPTHYVRVLYDFSRGTSAFNAFGCEVINQDNIDNRFNEIVESNFNEIFTKSKENKFYQKFPRWVHRLLKCD